MTEQSTSDKFWQQLRHYTEARIGLGRSGGSLKTHAHLEFQYAHACAQDAVWRSLDWAKVEQELLGLLATEVNGSAQQIVRVQSQAQSRSEYLQRPDLGRCLSQASQQQLEQLNTGGQQCDAVIVLADGLSATAVENQGAAMCAQLIQLFNQQGLHCPVIVFAQQARVAFGDGVAAQLNARHLLVLVGERPGLSSPNSLGMYYSYCAKPGYTDAQRNCISNIRPGGQSISQAAHRLMWLIQQAEIRKISGVALKDESEAEHNLEQGKNFLLPQGH